MLDMQTRIETHTEELKEEFTNCVTSAIGVGLALMGAFLLIEKALEIGGSWRITSITLYAITTVLGLTASALYHGIRSVKWKSKLRVLDHASIYLMIAGGYSPLFMISLKNDYGGILCAILWFIALLCIVWKVFYFNMPESLSLTSYMLLGWLGIFLAKPLMASIPSEGLGILLGGGTLYTIGTFFYLNDHRKYFHAIWHLFVLLASTCHFWAIYKFVVTAP